MRTISYLLVLLVMALFSACSAAPPPATSNPTVVAGAVATPEPTATLVVEAQPAEATPAVTSTSPTSTPEMTPIAVQDALPAGLDLSSYAGRPGQSVTLRGQGFGPGESVHVEFEGSPAQAVGDYIADELGRIVAEDVLIPMLSEGQYTLTARDGSGREASRVFSIVGFHPWVVLSSYAIHPGESFGFTGSEFVPGEEVQVLLDGGQIPVATVQADAQGNVQHQGLLQARPRDVGKHDLLFVTSSSDAQLPVAFEVLAYVPLIELSPYAGPPGSAVTFQGRGFAQGETVHVYRETDRGRQELGTFQADSEGAFRDAGAVVVAADDSDKIITYVLEGEESRVPVSQRFGLLELSPWAGLSQYSGPAGTQLSFLGKGFAASEMVDVVADGEIITTVRANAQGEFEAGPYVVSANGRDNVDYHFKGQNSKGEASATFTVTGN